MGLDISVQHGGFSCWLRWNSVQGRGTRRVPGQAAGPADRLRVYCGDC
ncbi:hypothetical protein RSPO_m00246 (plasmid) [Ralstonia solanacearum Po82]|uniref:Uncharacterized protein n=1 Tax=Ralstonia solanacearum (strain Po82) TaxID=1031711 RepID=F6G7F0_RALS8|nr:hypothetical protein RSPO_m00246 [Ralstonia solanacearum Po82]